MKVRWTLLGLSIAVSACDKGLVTPPAPSASSPPAAPSATATQVTSARVSPSGAPTPTATPPKAPGRVVTAHFNSTALGVSKSVVVYLPGGYDAGTTRYPVTYLLHGLGGNETNWVHYGHIQETADAMGLDEILVMPDGDDGFYTNWAAPSLYDQCLLSPPPFDKAEKPETYCVRTPRYEDYIVKDLLAWVDSTYRTIQNRKGRAIAGLSMGGFGALSLAMRHKDLFNQAASHSGVVSLLYAAPHPFAAGKGTLVTTPASWGSTFPEPMREHVRKVFGSDLANWKAHDPSVLATTLKDGELRLYLDCGSEDGFKLQDEAAYVHEILDAGHVTHFFALVPGVHHFDLWKVRIKESLAFLKAGFQDPQ